MEKSLVIDVARLDRDGEEFEGVLDDAVLDLHDEYLHPFAGIRYRLFVQLAGRELIARGALEQDFEAVCSRCGADFDFTATDAEITVMNTRHVQYAFQYVIGEKPVSPTIILFHTSSIGRHQ